MNIGYVTNVPYPFVKGGAQKRVYEVATRLANRGHDVTIYSRHSWNGGSEEVFDGVIHRAVADARDLYVNDRRSIYEPIDFSVRVLPELRKHISDHDVVTCAHQGYFPILGSKLGTVGSGTPLVTIWQEVWDDYWKEYLGHLGIFGRFTENITARIPQYPVAVSEFTANRLVRVGVDRDSIEVIPNGIDLEEIVDKSPSEEAFDIVFVGRFTPNKEIEMLLRAFDEVAKQLDVKLCLIGDGPQMGRLRTIQSDMENGDLVTFTGYLDNDEAIARMKSAKVFVSPSAREGFGIVFAEAMAADCIVITTEQEHSAAAEVIGNGGFIVNHSVNALTEIIQQALNGRRPPTPPTEVVQQFDWGAIVDKEAQLYQKIA